MQQLHLVGFTTEHDGLIYAARRGAKSGSFVVDLDDELLETIEEILRRRDGGGTDDDAAPADDRDGRPPTPVLRPRQRPPRPESFLTPREMQARLRSGRTIAQVAKEAGVEEEWVERFAAPIFAEQAQVIQRARVMTSNKPRLGDSSQDLGTSVLWNLADRGIRLYDDEFDRAWAAQHWRGTTWVIRFQYVSRKKTQTAEWELDLREGSLLPRNRLASDLGYVEPGRRRKRLPPLPERAPKPEPTARRGSGSARPAAKRTAAKRTATKRAAPKKTATKKATATRTAAKKTAAKKTTAKKTAARKTAAKKTAAKKAPARTATRATATKAPTRKAAARTAPVKAVAAAKRSPARKAAPRKATPRKAAAKRAPARKRAAKAPAKKSARPAAARRAELIVVPRPRARLAPRPATIERPVVERFDGDDLEAAELEVLELAAPVAPFDDAVELDGADLELDDFDDAPDEDDEHVDVAGGGAWAGPGSDEPAPSLTIRADLAAAAASARERAAAPVDEAPAGGAPEPRRRRLFRR